MANPGDTKERFGRSYIYLIPCSDNNFDPGTWRVRVDDEGTPPIDGGGGGCELTSASVLWLLLMMKLQWMSVSWCIFVKMEHCVKQVASSIAKLLM